MKTIAIRQSLLLTKFKICTVLPRNIMAVYEEDELHCYRSITSKFCLNATYRCLCFELYFWNSPKLLAVVGLFSRIMTITWRFAWLLSLHTGAGILFGSCNCAKRESPIYTQTAFVHSCAFVCARAGECVGVAHVKSDTLCGCMPAGIGGGVTDLPDHLQVQFVI